MSALISAAVKRLVTQLATSFGAAAIGWVQAGAGAVLRTLQSKLRELVGVSITDYGADASLPDNTTAIQNALNTGRWVIVPPAPTPYITRKIMPAFDGQKMYGAGKDSCLQFKTGEVGEMFNSDGKAVRLSNIRIFGGDDSGKSSGAIPEPIAASVNDRTGLLLDFETDTVLDCVIVHGFKNRGIKPRNAVAARNAGFVIQGSHVYNCWAGLDAGPNVAEYLRANGNTFNGNQLGLICSSGNVNVNGGVIGDNYINVRVLGTAIPNNAHGSVVGVLMNHATLYAIECIDVTNGFLFSACNIFYGDIGLLRSSGVSIVDGIIDWRSMIFEGGGRNIVARNFMPQGDLAGALQNSVLPNRNGNASNVDFFENYNTAGLAPRNRRILKAGLADFVAGDQVIAHFGETGIMETAGLSLSSDGGLGVFKLRAMNAGVLATEPTLQIDRATGRITKLRLGLSYVNAVNDAAAATAGVAIGETYRNGNALLVRLV